MEDLLAAGVGDLSSLFSGFLESNDEKKPGVEPAGDFESSVPEEEAMVKSLLD